MNKTLVSILLLTSLPGFAATVLDVSKEWNIHASSSPTAMRMVKERQEVVEASNTYNDAGCACETLKPQEYLEDSTYAFTGFVSEGPPAKKGKRQVTFDVDENFKGETKPEMKVLVEVKNDGCDLPFKTNEAYLVFSKWEWGTVSTHRCMGTKFLDKARKNALGPSEQMKEKLYIHLRNACMGRRDTSCCLNSLKAMKAGYYVPEPEAGCPDGTQPDRLRCSGSYTWCIPSTEKRFEQ